LQPITAYRPIDGISPLAERVTDDSHHGRGAAHFLATFNFYRIVVIAFNGLASMDGRRKFSWGKAFSQFPLLPYPIFHVFCLFHFLPLPSLFRLLYLEIIAREGWTGGNRSRNPKIAPTVTSGE